MLGRVIGKHWHALARDVLALGYRPSDILTELTLADMVSIVVGAGPNTSVRYFLDEGWSREAHLLANMQEGQAGLANLDQPYQRPGNEQRQSAPTGFFQADEMTWEEMDERNKKRYGAADQGVRATNTRVRKI